MKKAFYAPALGFVIFAAGTGAVAQIEPLPAPAVSPEQLIGAPDGPPLVGAELDRETEDLASIMRCPVCQALSVNDSPSLSAIAIKEEIRDLLAAGYTREQVMRYFEQAYGEFIRLEPRARGFNLVVWWAPAVALLLGAAVIFARLAIRRSATADEAVATVADAAGTAEEPTAPIGASGLEPYLDQVRREVSE